MIGKTASCAAMALTFAVYSVPEAWGKPVAFPSFGALGCVVLVVIRPLLAGALGVGVLAVGVPHRFMRLRLTRPANPQQ